MAASGVAAPGVKTEAAPAKSSGSSGGVTKE